MARRTAYTPGLVALAMLCLVLAACTPAGPAVEAPSPSPAPAEPTPASEPSPTAAPPAAASPSPTSTAPGGTPPSDPYGTEYGTDRYGKGQSRTPVPATPDAGETPTLALTQTDAGQAYLVGPTGHALYVFTEDAAGVSNCAGSCAETWPPLTLGEGESPSGVEGISGMLDVIERDDGSRQVIYDGAPLYYYEGDQAAGETNGDGLGGVWFLAEP